MSNAFFSSYASKNGESHTPTPLEPKSFCQASAVGHRQTIRPKPQNVPENVCSTRNEYSIFDI